MTCKLSEEETGRRQGYELDAIWAVSVHEKGL